MKYYNIYQVNFSLHPNFSNLIVILRGIIIGPSSCVIYPKNIKVQQIYAFRQAVPGRKLGVEDAGKEWKDNGRRNSKHFIASYFCSRDVLCWVSTFIENKGWWKLVKSPAELNKSQTLGWTCRLTISRDKKRSSKRRQFYLCHLSGEGGKSRVAVVAKYHREKCNSPIAYLWLALTGGVARFRIDFWNEKWTTSANFCSSPSSPLHPIL